MNNEQTVMPSEC